MKQKLNIFRVGSKTYFHHQNGIVVRRNRLRLIALHSFLMVLVGSGFFAAYTYALPALHKSYLQARSGPQPVVSVPAEEEVQEPTQSPIKQDDEQLKAVIKEKLATFPSDQKWSVFFYDLNSDRTVNIGGDMQYDLASLYKLFLLEGLENKVPYDKWKKTYVDKKRISECVDQMLSVEDGPCAEQLAKYLGWDFVDEFNNKNGYFKTKLAGLEGRKTTPADLGELLIRLKKGQILSDKARRHVFDALYQQVYSKGIPLGCENCRTANKAGELTGIAHDAGIVTHGANSYVLVVMSAGGSFEQISDITKLIDSRYSGDATTQLP